MEKYYNIKTNRIFTPIRKYAWIYIPVVAGLGMWYPKLGLTIIPMMITLLVMGLFKGRYWCGNVCPHGSLFDQFIMPISINKKVPKFFKSKIVISLAFAWFMFMFFKRIKSVAEIWGTISFWDKFGFIFVVNYLITTIVGTSLSLLVSPRSWCGVCPMGTLQGLSHKAGKTTKLNTKTNKILSIESKEKCHKCGKCARVCPMQLEPYLNFDDETNQFNDDKCIKCGTCVANCPANILGINTPEETKSIKESASLKGYENRQSIEAQIEKINQLADDTIEYNFKFINPKKVDLQAGQFIMVRIKEDPIMYRSYSISSIKESGLSITIKKVNKGYGTSIIFDNFKEGDNIILEGPLGDELVVDKTTEELLFIAGGIGITPFIPMIEDIKKDSGAIKKVSLVYGVNKQDEFLYEDQFEKLQQSCHRLELIKVVAFDDTWSGPKGFVTDVIKNMDIQNRKIYMCGPKPMIDASTKVLHEMQVPKENIFAESA